MMDINFKKFAIIAILILSAFTSLVFMDDIFNNNTLEKEKNTFSIDLNTSLFSKDDYEPILDEPLQGLGNISIAKLTFNEVGFYNHSVFFPNLEDDVISGALNITYLRTSYIETVEIAQFNNIDESLPQSDKITVMINESISIQYNTSIGGSEGYLIYNPRLFPRNLIQVFIQNQSDPDIIELSEEDYFVDPNQFLKFNYQNYFNTEFHNFSMYFIFEYDITPHNWELSQVSEEILTITQQEQDFSPSFYYNFTLTGTKLTNNVTDPYTLAENLVVELLIDPLDKDLFFDHSLEINEQNIADFLLPNNKINVTISTDAKLLSLKFTANFTLRFEDPVDYSWAIDRLIRERDIRQRIYFPSLVAGPEHIFLKDITLIENTIISDQVIKNISLFERPVNYFDVIELVTQETVENSLIFTDNAVKRKGLKITVPYLIVGETNPCTVDYTATSDLNLIISDSTRMPLVGYRLELIYFGKKYGTFISNDVVQPMSEIYSDENGEVLIENVPNGNYTVRIYQGNTLVSQTLVNTFSEVNYLVTDVIHFPLWIMIFGGISGILLLIGIVLHLNYKKRS